MQLEGKIQEIDILGRLVELYRQKFTGAFRFEQDGVIKILYFRAGDVLSASTNDRTDSVDEILLRAGKITREHIKQALARRKESETLGDALLNLGFITRKELTWARRVQVIGILRSVRAWHDGSFTGVADYLPKREEGTLFPLPQILLELIVTDPDRGRFEQATNGGSAVFAKTEDFDESYHHLGLNDDADAIVREIDGVRSAAEIAAASGKDAFNVYKLLEALRVLGLIRHTEGPADEFAAAGVSDAADVFELGDEPPLPETTETELLWETPAPMDVPLAVPAPASERIEPPWGFDEAQIETVKRAAAPQPEPEPPPMKEVVKKASKPGKLAGVVITLVLIVIGAFGGYAAWLWWSGRAAVPTAGPAASPRRVVVTQKKTAPPPPAPVVERTVTTATTATIASVPPPPAPAPGSSPGTAPRQPAGTPAVAVTPETTATTSPDALRAKYDAMARDNAANAAGAYTVQFELVCETASVTKALAAGGSSVWFVPTTYRGRPCYRVFWGRYDTREAAQSAAASIPAALKGSGAAVVKIAH